MIPTADSLPAMRVSQAILELASDDGWLAVYDPTNPETREVVDGRIAFLADGLGNLPPLTQESAESRPDLLSAEYGLLDGAQAAVPGGPARYLRSVPFATPMPQPNFIMALGRNADLTPGTRVLVDGAVASKRNAILTSARQDGGYGVFARSEAATTEHALDLAPHLFGAQYDGQAGTALWIDGEPAEIEYLLQDQPLNGITWGDRYFSNGTHWNGTMGPLLVYDGVPPEAVRERMTRLLLDLAGIHTEHPVDLVVAQTAYSTDRHGNVEYEKNADTFMPPASTIKMLTAYVARRIITDNRLDELVTVSAEDDLSGTTAPVLQVGDQVTYRDLLYGMMLPSHNAMARILARAVGDQLEGQGGVEGFLDEMRSVATDDFGWTEFTFANPSGLGTVNQMTARQIAELLWAIADEDPLLVEIMGAITRSITITGPNPRTTNVTHTIELDGPVRFPEFIAGKTGTWSGNRCLAFLWQHPDGERRVSTFQWSTTQDRWPDMRAIMDYIIGGKSRTVDEVITDIATVNNLATPGSRTRRQMDALYGERASNLLDISDRFPGIDTSASGAGVSVIRIGSTVTVSFAAVTLPAGFDRDAVIPPGFRPPGWVYGELIPDHSTTEQRPVQIASGGRVQVRGNTSSELLRQTLTWQTLDPWP